MIAPDANILVYAYNIDAPEHVAARRWWNEALAGSEPIGLAWITVIAFIRLTTSHRVFKNPLSIEYAIAQTKSWLENPNVTILHPSERHAEILFGLIQQIGTAGNLTTDAHLAALGIEHSVTIATTDRDFRRFPGLKWFNPLSNSD